MHQAADDNSDKWSDFRAKTARENMTSKKVIIVYTYDNVKMIRNRSFAYLNYEVLRCMN